MNPIDCGHRSDASRTVIRRKPDSSPTDALEDRIAELGKPGSWPEILADLDSLTETEVEQDDKRFMLRSAPRRAASLALRAGGVALPPTVRLVARNLIPISQITRNVVPSLPARISACVQKLENWYC
jgi:hypothetical protein